MSDFLDDPKIRAEDIILGSQGFGESARIIEIVKTPCGYKGKLQWQDGDQAEFESVSDQISDLEKWALDILVK